MAKSKNQSTTPLQLPDPFGPPPALDRPPNGATQNDNFGIDAISGQSGGGKAKPSDAVRRPANRRSGSK